MAQASFAKPNLLQPMSLSHGRIRSSNRDWFSIEFQLRLPFLSTMDTLDFSGATSIFYRIQPGVILKSPRPIWPSSKHYEELTTKISSEFFVEETIQKKLEDHPPMQSDARRMVCTCKDRYGNMELSRSQYLRIPTCLEGIQMMKFPLWMGLLARWNVMLSP
jgi:hypothetical protein